MVSVVKLHKLVVCGHKVLLLKTKKTIINRFCSNIVIALEKAAVSGIDNKVHGWLELLVQGVSFANSKA